MNTTSLKSIEQRLRSYSAYVEFWDDEAGDSHELLGNREVLHDRLHELSTPQVFELRAIDDQVLALVDSNSLNRGWDIIMLRKTADLIRSERAAPQRHAA